MISLTLEQACSPQWLYQGWQRTRKNRKLCNAFTLEEWKILLTGLEDLSQQICGNQYWPKPLQHIPLPSHGKIRHLSLPTLKDCIVQSALSQALIPLLDPYFENCSFAYRPGRSIQMAQAEVVSIIRTGHMHLIKTDIDDCFDTIPYSILQQSLELLIQDQRLTQLILRSISVPIYHNNRLYSRSRGIPQGSPLSPLLCNIALDWFDKAMIDSRFLHVRYSDDIIFLAVSKNDLQRTFHFAQKALQSIGLCLNPKKTYVTTWQRGYRFLGQNFQGGYKPWQSNVLR